LLRDWPLITPARRAWRLRDRARSTHQRRAQRRPAASEITEVLLHSAVYCAMPRSINATLVAKKVFAERELLPGPPRCWALSVGILPCRGEAAGQDTTAR
jgi:hypothetical protein